MASIERAAASIREGNSFLIFPEGTRSRTAELLAIQEGRLHHGHQGAGADRPGGHLGRARSAMQKGSWFVRPGDGVGCGSASRSRRPGMHLDDRDRARSKSCARASKDYSDANTEGLTTKFDSYSALCTDGDSHGSGGRWGFRSPRASTSTPRWRCLAWRRATAGSSCPISSSAFDNPWIIGIAAALYLVEFVADKIPWVDSLWDSVHTADPPARRRADRGGRARPGLAVLRRRSWRWSARTSRPAAT